MLYMRYGNLGAAKVQPQILFMPVTAISQHPSLIVFANFPESNFEKFGFLLSLV